MASLAVASLRYENWGQCTYGREGGEKEEEAAAAAAAAGAESALEVMVALSTQSQSQWFEMTDALQ